MNKIKFLMGCGCLALLMLPVAAVAADDVISMVAFFPTPYMAYNNVYITNKLDIGTYSGDFKLTTGPLQVNDAFLRAIDTSSSLAFDTDVHTPNVTFGLEDGQPHDIVLKFKKLRVDALSSQDAPLQEIQTSNGTLTVNGQLFLGTASLPDCSGTVSWGQVTLPDEAAKYFLVCQ